MIPTYLIETFVYFGETSNLVKTAQILKQTQPTTSRQIELLQGYFKKPLFKTVGRNKLLTEYGKQVQQYYKKSVFELRELQAKMPSIYFENQKEKLIVAARSEILQKYISELNFKSTTEFLSLTGQEIRQRMHNQLIDVAVLQENFESLYYFRKKLFQSNWKVIFPSSWKSKTSNLSKLLQFINQASPLPFASYDHELQAIKANWIDPKSFPKLNIEMIASDWRLIHEAVKKQSCWSIVPCDFAKDDRITVLNADEVMRPSSFYIYALKNLSKNKDVLRMIEELKISS